MTLCRGDLYPSWRADCDVAALVIEVSGCLPICGAGTIGPSAVLIKEGLVTPRVPGMLALEWALMDRPRRGQTSTP